MTICTCGNPKRHVGDCPKRSSNAQTVARYQSNKRAAQKKLNADSLAVIEQFMPNISKCFGIDFDLLNETLIALRKAVK